MEFREVGHENVWCPDGTEDGWISMSSEVALEREEIAYELYNHADTMYYCASCKCHMKQFLDFTSKCKKCRRSKKNKRESALLSECLQTPSKH